MGLGTVLLRTIKSRAPPCVPQADDGKDTRLAGAVQILAARWFNVCMSDNQHLLSYALLKRASCRSPHRSLLLSAQNFNSLGNN